MHKFYQVRKSGIRIGAGFSFEAEKQKWPCDGSKRHTATEFLYPLTSFPAKVKGLMRNEPLSHQTGVYLLVNFMGAILQPYNQIL